MSDLSGELLTLLVTAPEARKREALRVLQGLTVERRKPGTIRQAAAILECNPRTVQRYAAKGLLKQIRLSPRRVRYDLNEVARLSECGVPSSEQLAGGSEQRG